MQNDSHFRVVELDVKSRLLIDEERKRSDEDKRILVYSDKIILYSSKENSIRHWRENPFALTFFFVGESCLWRFLEVYPTFNSYFKRHF